MSAKSELSALFALFRLQAPGTRFQVLNFEFQPVCRLWSAVLFRIGEENISVGQDDAFESKLASWPLNGGRSRD